VSHITRRSKAVISIATTGALAVSAVAFAAVGAQAAPAHVDNPYEGATQYVNASWSAEVEGPPLAPVTRRSRQRCARSVSSRRRSGWTASQRSQATSTALAWRTTLTPLDAAAGRDAGRRQRRDLRPARRDCYALASNGELPATDAGLARYKAEYIDPIAAILAQPKYQDLRISTVVEPDSLPNLVTNISEATCSASAPYYKAGWRTRSTSFTRSERLHLRRCGALWMARLGQQRRPAATLFADVAKSTQADSRRSTAS